MKLTRFHSKDSLKRLILMFSSILFFPNILNFLLIQDFHLHSTFALSFVLHCLPTIHALFTYDPGRLCFAFVFIFTRSLCCFSMWISIARENLAMEQESKIERAKSKMLLMKKFAIFSPFSCFIDVLFGHIIISLVEQWTAEV